MSVLILRLAGPLQSWGTSSRFARREAGREPSKSGIVGLIAAAQGRRRTDAVEDLVALRLGVRSDQPGRLVRDYQTARHPSWPNAKLSTRYYLGDAVFVAALEADAALLEGIDEAIRSPAFPPYLGRRSCPPSGPISLGIRDAGSVEGALRDEPWHASDWWQRHEQASRVRVAVSVDAVGADGRLVRDVPMSFSQEKREYSWRKVETSTVTLANPARPERGDVSADGGGVVDRAAGHGGAEARASAFDDHDFWGAVEA